MQKKMRVPKRIIILLLAPLLIITLITVAYGILLDYVLLNLNLSMAPQPAITINSTLLNAPDNLVILEVNTTTQIIEDTVPSLLQISINVTNTGETPINKIVAENALPNYWNWTSVYAEPYFITTYDTATHTMTITFPDIQAATGKSLNPKESFILIVDIEYSLKGEPLPAEYEISPPNYTYNATILGWIGAWQSEPATVITNFMTYIHWV